MKIYLLTFVLFCSALGFSQEDTGSSVQGNNEVKLNLGYAIAGLPEITYERVIDDGGSVGLSLAFSVDENINFGFIAVPYYRLYFGQKRAAGFFIEANAGIFSDENSKAPNETAIGFGPGLAVGGKFLTKTEWVAEIVFGGGRNFINESVISGIYPRLGISIGKRF